jgi:DnaJ family protein C protein 28
MDRLVEDLIQESMSRGEFDNLAGSGKPLRHQASNPYVDFVTHKMNQVMDVQCIPSCTGYYIDVL